MGLTDKQKANRALGLGSSDAPIVAGVSPYCGPLELYYKLHGELPRYSDDETWEQKAGSKFEPVIAEIVAEELNLNIRRSPVRRHPKHSFMVAHLDFEIVNHPQGPGILEIKRRSGQRFDTLPDDIHLQVLHQMAVTNREWAKVAVLFGWGKPVVFDVERDKEMEEYLIELEARFMVRVEKSDPPTEAWTPETVDLLKRLYPTDSGKEITLPEEYLDSAIGLIRAKAEIEADEAIKASYEGNLKKAMGDASLAIIPGFGKISWKSTKPGKKFDEDAFAREHPELYAKYQTTRPGYRRFLVTPSKEVLCKS